MRPDIQKRMRDPRNKKRWVMATYRYHPIYGYFQLRWQHI